MNGVVMKRCAGGMVLLFVFIFLPGLVFPAGSVAVEGGKAAAVSSLRPAAKVRYLELSLYNRQSGASFASPEQPLLLSVLQIIKRARDDKNIRGIILNTSGFSADRTVLWELRGALENFKAAGKKLVAFFDAADIDLYCLVSVADCIVMDDLGTLTFGGYVYGRGYYRSALEKLGVGVRELRFFNYKSALESYTRSGLSEADRRQYGIYLDDIFGLTKETIMKARSLTEREFDTILNREFLYSAAGAKARGLVDAVGRKDALIRAAEELEGRALDGFVFWGGHSAGQAALTGGHSSYRLRRGFGFSSSLLHLWIFAPSVTQKSRLSGLLWQFAG
jgi:hypothetical protein